MIIDWYTIIFQIINFMILVFLLRLFLYKPIIKAMDEREQKIIEREEEAGRTKNEAEETALAYNRKSEELERQEAEILEKARSAAEEEKQQLMNKARQEVDETKQRWAEAFKKEKDTFIAELRRRIGQQACMVARRCLEDLADSRLEELTWNLFREKIEKLPEEEITKLIKALDKGDGKMILKSAFDPPDKTADQLQQAIKKILPSSGDNIKLSVKKEPALICGLELETGGYRIAWNIESYLENVEAEILKELEQTAPTGSNGEVAGGEETEA
jgi:F-type H+-transporting ATPase subunit b